MEIKLLDDRLTLDMMQPATDGSAGYDLYACTSGEILLRPFETQLVPLGFAMHINHSECAALILPRSGAGGREGIVLGNLVGLIDSDYQGQVSIVVWNRNNYNKIGNTFAIQPMQRIAQMIFVPVIHPIFKQVQEFSNLTERGAGGYGSTGL